MSGRDVQPGQLGKLQDKKKAYWSENVKRNIASAAQEAMEAPWRHRRRRHRLTSTTSNCWPCKLHNCTAPRAWQTKMHQRDRHERFVDWCGGVRTTAYRLSVGVVRTKWATWRSSTPIGTPGMNASCMEKRRPTKTRDKDKKHANVRSLGNEAPAWQTKMH